jgi:hypothetical protein
VEKEKEKAAWKSGEREGVGCELAPQTQREKKRGGGRRGGGRNLLLGF